MVEICFRVLCHEPNDHSVRRGRMPRSKADTSKRSLARIQRLCCLGVGGEMLMPDLIRQVNELIPLRGGFFLWMNPNLERTNSCGMCPIPTAALYHKEFHLPPR